MTTPGVRLIVLGKQGSGKGTQCTRLSHYYSVPHISTGDMLRANVEQKTPLGLQAQKIMDAGQLLPDEIVMEMVADRLGERNVSSRGFILDGFPRSIRQAELLEAQLAPITIDLAIELDVPRELVLDRIASRRTCKDCGKIYSLNNPPVVQWICDQCGGNVAQRSDDTPESVNKRLDVYEESTFPLIDFYQARALLKTIDAVGNEQEVMSRIISAIEERRAAK
jgi:adenylate kinase